MGRWPRGPALLTLGLGACGVTAPPRPPAPPAPQLAKVLSTPEGLELHLEGPRPALLHPPEGPPQPIRGSLRLPRPGPEGWRVRLSAADGVAPGPPGPPLTLRWSPPPPPPPAPMAFHRAGEVQILWLPPPEGTVELLLYRDDQLLDRLPPGRSEAVDRAAAPGLRRYTLRYQTAAAVTGPSPAAAVTVP